MRIVIVLILLFYGSFSEVFAQRVYEENGKFILDLTKETGMPKEAITDIPKYTGTYIGNNNRYLVDYDFAKSENEKVFQKLEIAPGNLDKDGCITDNPNNGLDKILWAEAFNYCKALEVDGVGGWRLPTQRELQLIWIFKEGLEKYSISKFGGDHYWSATEGYMDKKPNNAWQTSLDSGYSYDPSKSTKTRARCVREVKP